MMRKVAQALCRVLLLHGVLGLLFGCKQIHAYVPAQPTNSTQEAIEGGLNVTDISKLYLRWYPNGYYSQNVSYQLAGYGSQGTTKGALVHFSETRVNNSTPPTITPWIAMVSCDFNATNASQEEDVFTLARDKGAVAALLYSQYSLACVINPEYADPETFDQVFDIFSTQSLISASLIQYQFGQFGPTNESLYGVYDSQRLNETASMMNTTLQDGTPSAPGYLFAILQAYNSTVQLDDPSTINGAADSSPPRKQGSNLAMIILYAITGCVTALFCVVIITGAVRAIRHPERYGPRARGRGGLVQSRARGLTRAILDTFPVVKFGVDPPTPDRHAQIEEQDISVNKDATEIQSHSTGRNMELKELRLGQPGGQDTSELEPDAVLNIDDDTGALQSVQSATDNLSPRARNLARPPVMVSSFEGSSSRGRTFDSATDVVPASIGRETCPICIMDFEEGDDLRLLPCEGKHRFHQSCVDPWLLELSSSCPICREDFLALENIISGEPQTAIAWDQYPNDSSDDIRDHTGSISTSNPRNRFSRYLHFARRQRHRRTENNEHPPEASLTP